MTIPLKVRIGAVCWCAFTYFTVATFTHGTWTTALLLLAALVLMPMTWCLARDLDDAGWAARLWKFDLQLQLPAAVLLMPAFLLPTGLLALVCTVPWAVLLLIMAVDGIIRITRHGLHPLGLFCRDVGLVYAAVGGFWLLAERAGWRPFGLSAHTLLLTAVHFHFAGLILPVLSGLVLARRPDCPVARWSSVLILIGAPLVALSMIILQLGGPHWLDFGAAWILALGGLGVALQHLVLGWAERTVHPLVRGLWGIAGICLAVGMVLTLFYSARVYLPTMAWLDLPWMRMMHGSLNAVGFSLAALLAWCRAGRKCCCGN